MNDRPARFLLAGAATIDRIGTFETRAGPGLSVPGRIRETCGGAALNVASNLAAFHNAVTLSSIIGIDTAAHTLTAEIEKRAIRFLPQHSDRETATYTALLQPDGGLAMALADMAICDTFNPNEIITEIGHLQRNDWLVIDANLPATAIGAMCERAQCKIAALSVSAAKAPRLKRFAADIDLLLTNRAEAEAIAEPHSTEPLLDTFAELGFACVVLSNGHAKIAILDRGTFDEVDVPPADVIRDVTGAGDALAAGILHGLATDSLLKDAICFGVAAAQSVLTVAGPYRDDLLAATHGRLQAWERVT